MSTADAIARDGEWAEARLLHGRALGMRAIRQAFSVMLSEKEKKKILAEAARSLANAKRLGADLRPTDRAWMEWS